MPLNDLQKQPPPEVPICSFEINKGKKYQLFWHVSKINASIWLPATPQFNLIFFFVATRHNKLFQKLFYSFAALQINYLFLVSAMTFSL